MNFSNKLKKEMLCIRYRYCTLNIIKILFKEIKIEKFNKD